MIILSNSWFKIFAGQEVQQIEWRHLLWKASHFYMLCFVTFLWFWRLWGFHSLALISFRVDLPLLSLSSVVGALLTLREHTGDIFQLLSSSSLSRWLSERELDSLLTLQHTSQRLIHWCSCCISVIHKCFTHVYSNAFHNHPRCNIVKL